ncbi:ABC transporter ATP-binding protein [Piscirickettsia salmonis]|uniref:ABC transporter ATP-binding protein n=1 Tax=Piscirickettsia salmonis TaxID=1238 RepID=UPI0007C87E8B|nr:Oligopeptide transport ATP-binding protein OppD [Piscirickettsiaceae bacterium NZ-RLO1]
MAKTVLQVDQLAIHLSRYGQVFTPVREVSLSLKAGTVTALVGESGSGKSLTALSLLALLPTAHKTSGCIWFFDEGKNKPVELLTLSVKEIRKLRGCQLSMIFQDPFTALNPVFTVGQQVAEVTRLHDKVSMQAAKRQVIKLFDQVGLADPELCFQRYPHELSGGMRQRVMIAMAMICRPRILIADEPTTALDVTVQAQIIALLHHLKQEFNLSILLITHDMGVVAELADEVAVMYAGEIVEYTGVHRLFGSPSHPYTQGLLASVPRLNSKQVVQPIPGGLPGIAETIIGCAFYPRCKLADERCLNRPELESIITGHLSRCFYAK